jgi:hypothetical protein
MILGPRNIQTAGATEIKASVASVRRWNRIIVNKAEILCEISHLIELIDKIQLPLLVTDLRRR